LLVRPQSADQLAELIGGRPSGGLIARGAGRSYGDPAQNSGGVVLDMTALDGVEAPDLARQQIRVDAGVGFARLLEQLASHGLTLPVVPGTRHLTVGGAIAADVHGKNHPAAGSIARHVSSLRLLTPAGGLEEVSPSSDPDLFAATLGGMGLTGPIAAATLRTVPLRRPYGLADVDRLDTIEDALQLLESDSHTHAIAWLDLLARGRRFGRAIATCSSEGADPDSEPLRIGGVARPSVPERFPSGLLRPATVRAFNAMLWRATPRRSRGRPMDISRQLFPLDRIAGWNRLYGAGGLVQYQFAVPSVHAGTMRAVAELLRSAGIPMYLATIKRLGPSSVGMLSFPLQGWTLAIDMPGGAPGLGPALERADELVAGAGGRVYLAKDSRMRPAALATMYPRVARFREIRERVDPQGVLRSDMARRLELSR
jgi:decaprenylphospho-beta-D-ribofuranose 2-oxidase